MDKMIGSLSRHAVTGVGAVASMEGFQSSDWRIALIGAAVSMFGMWLSYLEKRDRG